MNSRYCLISPCHNEVAYVEHTLETVTRQSVLPALWVIVDDGSTDGTPAILEKFARKWDFIKIIRREERKKRSVGPGVINAFYEGMKSVDLSRFEFMCKLDVDLELPAIYFQTLMERMNANPRIGTCSGKPYYPDSSGNLVSEKIGDEMSVGASKFYRVECFRQIGGFLREVMWDGIDCHRCRMLGWIACSWDDPELRFLHLRPMGSSEKGIWTGRVRWGAGQYFMGTSMPYMVASVAYRMSRPPFAVGGSAMLWGYFRSMLTAQPRYSDVHFRRFLRRYQLSCLFRGKRATVERLDLRQAAVWNPGKSARTSAEMPTPS